MTSDARTANPDVLPALRMVAQAAGIAISEAELEAVAPTVIALLGRPLNPPPSDLAETEPAFGLRMRKG